MKIYHNPRCSKSRNGLKFLEEKGCAFEVIKYLDKGLSKDQLTALIAKTGKKPFDFVRQHEQDYKDNYKGKTFTDEQWIEILSKNPKLLHRPIVENGDVAVLGNPPENISEII